VLTLAEVTAAAEGGPLVAKIAGSVSTRSEKKSARGNRYAFVGLSDPTGLYEVTVFSDVLDQSRQHLEAGCNVVLTVEATLEGETLKLLARTVAPVDAVADDAPAAGLRIHLDRAEAAAAVAALLARVTADGGKSRAPVRICVPDDKGREIDVALPGAFPVTAKVRGAIKAIGGVLLVEEL
jgi:DNA polymerase III subunit alpha